MRHQVSWLLAGLLFALAVGLMIGTVAMRAENVRTRRAVELEFRDVQDRVIEWRRLGALALELATPERLAESHWRLVLAEAERRQGQLQ